ncbi:multiple inositol polyphosphate phosphatase 1b [Denticeps clupeoides]|uniref:Multiple inositol polyphosphate phosphatase 1 n=1 Tax=Denticeps clupeoides TaxID=299321 RepID=A0AAY4D558_9TELE|nr:multiple inositol polyphosphate phosphatase 1 [Denticeps clupeoides]
MLGRDVLVAVFGLWLVRFSAGGSARPPAPPIASYFGTKGRYEEVNPYLIDDILSVNKSWSEPPSADCRPAHLTAVVRHGTRFPTAKNIRRIGRLHDAVLRHARSAHAWLDEIRAGWDMWYTEDMDGRLVEKGRDDHRHLAARLATAFPALISRENLLGGRVAFVTSSKHRCVESVEAFQQGLHGFLGVKEISYRQTVNDKLMRFFDHCKNFIEGVEKNKTALREVELFKSSAEMRNVQKRIADRLQVPHDYITPDLAEAAFFLCSYEFSIKSLNSPWCNLVDEADAQVLEYKNDLKQYWKRAYGHDVSRKSSCPLFHDLFRRLDQVVYDIRFGVVTDAVTIKVGHAETLLPLLSLLGFFRNDKHLTAMNFREQRQRAFRTSQIAPYAANLVFVLYECDDGVRLRFLLNERPLAFPDLSDPAPLYQTVRDHYMRLLNGCDFQKECELPRGRGTTRSEL